MPSLLTTLQVSELLKAFPSAFYIMSGSHQTFTFSLHFHSLQLDVPIMKQTGIDIETGQAVKIAVTPELLNTTAVIKKKTG